MLENDMTLEQAAKALVTVLRSGSGELTTTDEGVTILTRLEDGAMFAVSPALMDYMIEKGWIVAEEVSCSLTYH